MIDYKDVIAIIPNDESRKSLAFVRSLGKRGFHVHLFSQSCLAPARHSRYVDCVIDKRAGKVFNKTTRDCKLNVDDSGGQHTLVKFFLEEEEFLNHFASYPHGNQPFLDCLPSPDSFDIARDKFLTYKLANEKGFPNIPQIMLCEWDESQINNFRAMVGDLPIVTKPRRSTGSQGIRYYRNFQHFYSKKTLVQNDIARHEGLLIQERITGRIDNIGVSVLFDQSGQCINGFAHRRLNQYPLTGGPSTRRISIVDQELLNLTVKLLTELSWRGLAMVEWIRQVDTGRIYLVEINPRPWGSISLAIRSGQDFPVRYLNACLNVAQKPSFTYHVGVVNRWLLPGDVLCFLSKSKRNLFSAGSYFKGALRESEEWDKHDPLPFLYSILQSFLMIFQTSKWRLLRSKNLNA